MSTRARTRHEPLHCHNPECGQLFTPTHAYTFYCSVGCNRRATRLRRRAGSSDAYAKLYPTKKREEDPMEYNMNDYGEIMNGEGTFEMLRHDLEYGPVMLDWIDQEGTLLNVMFAQPKRVGPYFGGGELDARQDGVVVSIIGHGSYRFSHQVAPDYAGEKLRVTGTRTLLRLSNLINAAIGAPQWPVA